MSKASSKIITADIVVMPPDNQLLDVATEFQVARQYADELHALGRRVNHLSILLGAELNRLHTSLNIGRGGNQGAKSKNSTLPPWRELVTAQTGFSYDTCNNLMKAALAGKKHIPVLTAPDVVDQPFHQLPEDRQKEVKKAIAKVCDGKTMQQLMLDLGVVTPKKSNIPPPGGKSAKNDFKGGADTRQKQASEQTDASLAAAQQELAKEHLNGAAGIKAMFGGEAWKLLEDADLADLDNTLDSWRTAIKALMIERQTAALKTSSKKK